jgi:hypothetical protein
VRHISVWGRLSRRRLIGWAIVVLATAAFGAAVSGFATSSHYTSEHAAAVRALDERSSLVAERDRLERLADSRQAQIGRLSARLTAAGDRLGRKRTDLRYPISQWRRLKSQVTALQTKASSLQDDLGTARATAKEAYDNGYEDGYTDGENAVSVDSGSGAGGCDPNYEGACVPVDQGDVDCGDLVETDFYVVGDDVDGLDGDGDGIACESY